MHENLYGFSDSHASASANGAAPTGDIVPIAPPGGITSLRIFEDARREIVEAATVDQVKRILAIATGLAAAARQATDREMEAEAAVLKLEAERRLGQLMAAQKETVGLNAGTAGQGRPALGGIPETPPKKDDRPTLAEAGIDKNLAKRARAAAAMSEPEFAEAIEIKREEFSQAEVKNVVENESTTEKPPRKRKSRSKAAKAKAAAEAEAKRIDNIASHFQAEVEHLPELLAENPTRYGTDSRKTREQRGFRRCLEQACGRSGCREGGGRGRHHHHQRGPRQRRHAGGPHDLRRPAVVVCQRHRARAPARREPRAAAQSSARPRPRSRTELPSPTNVSKGSSRPASLV